MDEMVPDHLVNLISRVDERYLNKDNFDDHAHYGENPGSIAYADRKMRENHGVVFEISGWRIVNKEKFFLTVMSFDD